MCGVMKYRSHREISKAYQYSQDSGLCPVCQAKRTGHGVTCGDIECIALWVQGQPDPCLGLVPHGIQKYTCDIIVHVCFYAKHLYSFTPTQAQIQAFSGRYRKAPAYQLVRNQKTRTAGGYLVPPRKISDCVWKQIPSTILGESTIRDSMTTSQKGEAAQSIVIKCLRVGAFPNPLVSVARIDDKGLQIRGVDLIVTQKAKIEVKCDFKGGHKKFGGTGNLFLQVCESNPNKLY